MGPTALYRRTLASAQSRADRIDWAAAHPSYR